MIQIDEILEYASKACSQFNTQPWIVCLDKNGQVLIKADFLRSLPSIDLYHREMFISIGAFMEAMYLASSALGVGVKFQYLAPSSDSPDIAKVTLTKKTPINKHLLDLINKRKTVRAGFKDEEFSKTDQDLLKAGFKELIYYPLGTDQDRTIRSLVINSFVKNINNDEVYDEVSKWFRVKSDSNDGINITLPLIDNIKLAINNKKKNDIFKSEMLKKKLISTLKEQVTHGAGWLIFSTKHNTPLDWIVIGRIYYRLAVSSVADNIGLHPMTSALRSEAEYKKLKMLSDDRYPQLLVRTGYVDKNVFTPDDKQNTTTKRRTVKVLTLPDYLFDQV